MVPEYLAPRLLVEPQGENEGHDGARAGPRDATQAALPCLVRLSAEPILDGVERPQVDQTARPGAGKGDVLRRLHFSVMDEKCRLRHDRGA